MDLGKHVKLSHEFFGEFKAVNVMSNYGGVYTIKCGLALGLKLVLTVKEWFFVQFFFNNGKFGFGFGHHSL